MNRVPGSQSLFIARSRTETITNTVLYCSCLNNSEFLIYDAREYADCTWKESLPLCKPMKWKDTTCRKYGRTKREISDDFEFDVPLDVVKYETSLQNIEWKNGWNEQKAVTACDSFLTKSKLFTLCSKLTQTTQLTDKSTTIHVHNFDIAGVENISSLDIAEAVFYNDCPNDCSGLGLCQQGTCECDEGFEGEDCSVDRNKGPEVFGLIEESFCDLSKDHALSSQCLGMDFMKPKSSNVE
ncbi:unnamed protein product [Mytilus edulis]|uniref:EGF-like domain-containing protein n=1 Tax=Mytilus edulis TaxID=6550 RepID=A0A8S3QX48_MYTED|nr:unnamed protein product [Mytilus edulis]